MREESDGPPTCACARPRPQSDESRDDLLAAGCTEEQLKEGLTPHLKPTHEDYVLPPSDSQVGMRVLKRIRRGPRPTTRAQPRGAAVTVAVRAL